MSETVVMEENRNDCRNIRRGISGSTLKIIAIVTMLIDHIGAVVLARMILTYGTQSSITTVISRDALYQIYIVFRGIGRLAFPIFCFLLVEGFQRTGNRIRYAMRLAVFAFLSEIPFDLAFCSKVLEFSYQNVFFTLLIGLLTMMAVDAVPVMWGKLADKISIQVRGILTYLTTLAVIALGMLAATCLHTDYDYKGILCIMVLYFFRRSKKSQCIAGFCAFLWENYASLAFLLVGFYNGKRGMRLKMVFYLFYPLHLLILYGICVALGIHGCPAV